MLSAIRLRALNLLYPRRAVCAGCGDMLGLDRDDLCESCRMKLAKSWIGARMPVKNAKLDGAAYGYDYHGPAGGMVRNLKYNAAWILAEPMGADIAWAVERLRPWPVDFITSVPMHPARLRKRGRNHAELLARSVAARLDLEYRELIYRTRNTPPQARLDAKQRRRNVKDAFAVLPECREILPGTTVLLIDDVFTTGATMRNCVKALRSAGVDRIYFAAYAMGGGDDRG